MLMRRRYWIQEAIKEKGALSRQLGIPEKKKIPKRLLKAIVKAKAGQTIRNPAKTGKRRIKVTRLLEKRASLALTLKKLAKRKKKKRIRKKARTKRFSVWDPTTW
jgi:hypothetical protein